MWEYINNNGDAIAMAAIHTAIRTRLTLRRVTRDFMGNIMAKKRSPAITINVNMLEHIAVTRKKRIQHFDKVHAVDVWNS